MSLDFYKKHEAALKKYATPVNKKVRLGDGTTLKEILMVVTVKMRFTEPLEYDTKGGTEPNSYLATVTLDVFDTSHEVIIGIQTISTSLYDYFMKLMQHSRDTYYAKKLCASLSVLQEGDLVRPFPNRADDAPEDADMPLPGHFDDALYFLNVDHDERVKAYHDLFAEHVDKDFAAQTDIINLLKTEGEKVFVASNWDGIKDIPLVEYQFVKDFPEAMFSRARHVNENMAVQCKAELDRMLTYLLVPSSSPVVSPIVVAPKATKPFIRICGDFSRLNKYIIMPHVPIPNVKYSLEKIAKFKYFIDVDVTNAFHQFKLGDFTSNMLSIITPWGTFRPKFMLEGTTPATGILHATMTLIFKEYLDWMIVLFDNILILCETYADAYDKFKIFLAVCQKRNLFLKFEKSWLGVQQVEFFGYICVHKSFHLSEKRSKAIVELPFPENTKQMQSFLGSCLFFQSFIPQYSDYAAKLHDMTHKGFDWKDEKSWKHDYRAEYETMKKVISESFTLFYPDYSLPWILRTDASQVGVGGVLLQDCDGVLQPIMFQSSKFSDQATRWSTIEQEAYAIYYCVSSLAYYLRCKEFVIETDHRNLLFMYHSKVPKIIRWFIYLQSFNFLVRHIPGKLNIVADMLSRQWPNNAVKEFEDTLCYLYNLAEGEPKDFESVMRQVHGRRTGHMGVKRCWFLLNKLHPGHGFSIARIREYIAECPICQKDRLLKVASIPSIVKTLHVEHARSMVGIDTFEMPIADDGKRYLLVLVNFFTRYVYLYSVAHKDAETTASCVFHYICTFGLFDQLRSDPGSDFNSDTMKYLLLWLGPTRSLTLVDNPQADGVEGTNKQIHRHILAICMEENCKKQWSSPSVLPIVQLIVNEHVHSETGLVPMHAQFGDADAIYAKIPAGLDSAAASNAYVRLLRDNLKMIRENSAKYQAAVKAERMAKTPPEAFNRYPVGELVMHHIEKIDRKDKLDPRNQGPYEVVEHEEGSNVVQVRDLVHGNIKKFHQSEVQAFFGDREAAIKCARYDADQHEVEQIIAHRGNPEMRLNMEFLLKFRDGSRFWKKWSKEIDQLQSLSDYVSGLPQLKQLLVSAKEAGLMKKRANDADVTMVSKHEIVYVDIRSWGPGKWYSEQYDLPDKDIKTYVLKGIYGDFSGKKSNPKRMILLDFPALGLETPYSVDNWFVVTYGHQTKLNPKHVLLTSTMIREFNLDIV